MSQTFWTTAKHWVLGATMLAAPDGTVVHALVMGN